MLEKRLALMLSFLLIVPSLLVGWLGYNFALKNIISGKINTVGSVAANAHDKLNLTLEKEHIHADTLLQHQLDYCLQDQKLQPVCVRQKLTFFMHTENAAGVQLLHNGRLISTGPVNIPPGRAESFADGQLAAFAQINEQFYYYISIKSEPDRQLIVTYPLSNIQPIFIPPASLGQSGNLFLVNREGQPVIPPQQTGADKPVDSLISKPMQHCLDKHNNSELHTDPKGASIIHGFRYLPETNGGCIMAHIDQHEAFSAINEHKIKILIIVLLFLPLAFWIAHRLARRFMLPIMELHRAISAVMKGKQYVSLQVDGKDEVAEMAQSFNRMIQKLDDKSRELEDKVATRTESLSLMASVFQHSGEAMMITDKHNKIIDINPAFSRLTGYSREEVIGQDPGMLASGQTSPEVYEDMWQTLTEKGFWQGELWDRHKNGENYPKWLTISRVDDQKGNVVNYIASFTDMTERKVAEEKISYLAHYDTLTRLPNRFTLTQRLAQALKTARRNDSRLAVMFLDLDRFKLINDTLGHDAGDLLLIEVANRLKSCMRSCDIVSRLGGDEFVVVITEMKSTETAFNQAEKILNALAEPYAIHGNLLSATPSIGISIFPEDGSNKEALMKNADLAMYHAKQLGRNNYQFYEASLNQASTERINLEFEMREGLKNNQFTVYYQPKINSRTLHVIGLEALIRWNHPQRGMVSPSTFIPIAEETGLIQPLGEWILEQVFTQMTTFRTAGIQGIHVSINLSARQFNQKNLVNRLQGLIEQSDIEPGDIELEITESVTMSEPKEAIATMLQLRHIGLRLSIDDFGTGYSSLNYLKQFPVSTLKIDRSFVKDIETDHNDAAICKATIALAHSLGLDVVAEGVETEAQLNYLKRFGCVVVQGYYFSRPLPAEETMDFIKQQNALEQAIATQVESARIMLIDDDELICHFMERTIQSTPHQLTCFTEASTALTYLSEHPAEFDLIIADLVMPNMSGIDLIQQLRHINRNIPLIIASAFKTTETRKTFAAMETRLNLVQDKNYFILEKPLLVDDIFAAIDNALAGSADNP